MQHHDALGGKIGVPPRAHPVFEQVILVGVGVVGHLDRGTLVGVERCKGVMGILDSVGEVHPAHEVALIGGITHGSVSVVQIAAVIHDVPVAHAVIIAAIGGIEVRQAQAVTELVAECADAVYLVVGVKQSLKLVEHRISVDGHAVELEGTRRAAAPFIGFLHVPLAGPNALGHRTPCLRFAHASIEHDHHVNVAVTVVVILGEVHPGQPRAGFIYHRANLLVHLGAVLAYVVAIEGPVLWQVNGTKDVKHGGKPTA